MKTAKLPLYYIGMLLMALPFFFTSCSSDDDGFTPSAGGSDTAGQITGSDGEKLYILKSASNLNGNLNCSKELEHYAS